ncbi:MAG: hypothetical protein AABZ70_19075 [candidate division NC10 bacterium]
MTSAESQQLVEFLGRQLGEGDRQFTELRQDLLGHFDEIYLPFERLEQEYRATSQR